jgi:hypothetical protein
MKLLDPVSSVLTAQAVMVEQLNDYITGRYPV